MKFLFYLTVAAMVWIFFGCAGNGKGLDENGNPIGSGGEGPPLAFDPTFTNIQQNVFNPICTNCHIGNSAPEGMDLQEGRAYDLIVGITSAEKPQYLRVNPGNPDDSYIIRKLEGGPDIVGSQMPLNRTPLPPEVINSIRAWIKSGAPRN